MKDLKFVFNIIIFVCCLMSPMMGILLTMESPNEGLRKTGVIIIFCISGLFGSYHALKILTSRNYEN